MARIAGVDIPREKRLVISLTYIYGIGRTTASEICAGTGIDESTRVRDLTDAEVTKLRGYIEEHVEVEGDRRGLPVRGQRTHTNARTRKGPKKTVAGKKKVRK